MLKYKGATKRKYKLVLIYSMHVYSFTLFERLAYNNNNNNNKFNFATVIL